MTPGRHVFESIRTSISERTKTEWLFIGIFTAYILLSRGEISGDHTWRQSDVMAHILGFAGQNGLSPLEVFNGNKIIYDIPIYQFLVAKTASILGVPVLLAISIVNAFCNFFTSISMLSLAKRVSTYSTLPFIIIYSCTPIFIHYFSAPLPDNLAICLSAVFAYHYVSGGRISIASLTILTTACLIKSPCVFVFIIFIITYSIGNIFSRKTIDINQTGEYIRLFLIGLASLSFALGAEFLRKIINTSNSQFFGQDPSWYFGSLDQRVQFENLLLFLARHSVGVDFGLMPSHLVVITASIITLAVIYLLACIIAFPKLRLLFIAVTISLVLPWLVFTNVYIIHNYYSLPGQLFATLMIAAAIGTNLEYIERIDSKLFARLKKLKISLILALVTSLFISRIDLLGGKDNLGRNKSGWNAAKFIMSDTSKALTVYKPRELNLGPVVGGRTFRKTIMKTTDELQIKCNELNLEAFPSEGIIIFPRNKSKDKVITSACKDFLKVHSRSFIEAKDFIAWKLNN